MDCCSGQPWQLPAVRIERKSAFRSLSVERGTIRYRFARQAILFSALLLNESFRRQQSPIVCNFCRDWPFFACIDAGPGPRAILVQSYIMNLKRTASYRGLCSRLWCWRYLKLYSIAIRMSRQQAGLQIIARAHNGHGVVNMCRVGVAMEPLHKVQNHKAVSSITSASFLRLDAGSELGFTGDKSASGGALSALRFVLPRRAS
jgi:hypothetical protein